MEKLKETKLTPTTFVQGAKDIRIVMKKGGEDGKDGKDGIDGKDGRDGKDGDFVVGPKGDKGDKGESIVGPKGADGKDGVNGKDGKNGSPDQPDEIVEKVNQANKKIDPNKIKGLSDAFKAIELYGSNPTGYASGGANQITIQDEGTRVNDFFTTLNFVGAGVTASYLGNGIIAITIPGSSTTVYTETPTGAIDGLNMTYTTANTITTVYSFAINGMYLHPTIDYTCTGSTIMMVTPFSADLNGKPFTIIYS